jgi:hypothetical protein
MVDIIDTMNYPLSAELQSIENEVFNHYINTDTISTYGIIDCPSIKNNLTAQEQLQMERNLKERTTKAKPGYNIDTVRIRWDDNKIGAGRAMEHSFSQVILVTAYSFGLLLPIALPSFAVNACRYLYYWGLNLGQTLEYQVSGRPSSVTSN